MNRVSYTSGFHSFDYSHEFRTFNVLGVSLVESNLEQLKSFLLENTKQVVGDYITVTNVHTTVLANHDSEYLKIQNGGLMAIPDGGPLSWIARRNGFKNANRITGPDLMVELLKAGESCNARHFFYGSTTQTLKSMRAVILKKYPDANVVGMYSPPFRQLSKTEEEQVITTINDSHPDFIWVGLGAPKQEIWMAKHQAKLNGLMIGVGAAFDYLAGNISRAPKWMQKYSLEWLYRLIQDPKRLFGRYLVTNTRFIIDCCRERVSKDQR